MMNQIHPIRTIAIIWRALLAFMGIGSETRCLPSLISQAPLVVIGSTNNAGEYLDDVCSQIEKLTNKSDRVNGYMSLMRSACSVRLEEVGGGIDNGRSEGPEKAILLSNAYVVLNRMTEDVWTRMYLEGATGQELFDPWFELVAKMKNESARLGVTDASLYVDRVDQIERLFNLFYLEDNRRTPGKDEVASVQKRFQELVGRPMRNKDQYMSGVGRAVPYAKPHFLPTAPGELKKRKSTNGKIEDNVSDKEKAEDGTLWDSRYKLQ